jgi:hypothetical protein
MRSDPSRLRPDGIHPPTVFTKSKQRLPPTNLNFELVTTIGRLTGYGPIGSIVTTMIRLAGYATIVLAAAGITHGQVKPTTAADQLKQNFDYINQKILEMAEDFPAAKYDYKLKPEMRTFGAVIVHVASGNIFAGKAGNGEKVKWSEQEQDPAKYATKADCVALLKKSIDDANAALKANPEGPARNMQPFLAVLQHASEHYGLLVAYYRANGLVPPDSRPKK